MKDVKSVHPWEIKAWFVEKRDPFSRWNVLLRLDGERDTVLCELSSVKWGDGNSVKKGNKENVALFVPGRFAEIKEEGTTIQTQLMPIPASKQPEVTEGLRKTLRLAKNVQINFA